MKLMAAKGKLSSLKHVDVGVCEHCIFEKQKKVSFSRAGKTPKVENFWSINMSNDKQKVKDIKILASIK